MKILIVDDVEMNRRLLEDVLKYKGYDVITAANGAEALKKLQAQDFGLIISDIMMPVMDGFEFCRECKQDERLKDIPFIFYTATYKDEQDKRLALELGADRFILKPTEPKTFLKIVDDAIRDSKKPKIPSKKPTGEREKDTFKLYSERLVNKLEKKMLSLEKEVVQRKKAENDLKERFKELNCLYSLSQLSIKENSSIDKVLNETVKLIPPSWQYPEITCARITFNGKKYKSHNFKITKWKQSSDILVKGRKKGSVEVYYFEKKPKEYEGPFLTEERKLIDGITTMLNQMIERKWAEKELKASEERLKVIFEDAPDAIYLSDFKGYFLDGNKATEDMLGYKREEMIGKSFFDLKLLSAKELPKAVSALSKSALGKQTGPEEYLLNRKDGSYIPLEIRTYPVTINDKTAVLGIARDISERILAEEKLDKHREHLEELVIYRTKELAQSNTDLAAVNKELEAFSYSVSHDLRAPLRSMAGFSEILLSDYSDKLDGKGQDCLKRVCSASKRMAILIDDILDLSRITRREMKLEAINLSALAETIVKELKESQPEREVEVTIAKDMVTNGDKLLLQVALQNLIGNAWKFTGKHPKARIEFGTTNINDKKVFFIRDNGAGFDMAYSDKLFDAFQRLHGVDEFSGTGIGLATVQRIVRRHGGRIWAESEIEKGARFYFTLG